MRASGWTTRSTGLDNFNTLTRRVTMVNGKEMPVEDRVPIITQTVINTRVSGTATSKMDQGLTTTPMETSTKVNGSMVASTAKATIFTLENMACIKATGPRVARKDLGSWSSRISMGTRVLGRTTRRKERGLIYTPMVNVTRATG